MTIDDRPAGVSLPCASCDDLLFTNPFQLASRLLETLWELLQMDEDVESRESKEQTQRRQVSCAISARILSSVCVAASMSLQSELQSELIYNKLQSLVDSKKSEKLLSPLQHLHSATLLHAKFLLELCFGRANGSGAVRRLALGLFGAMQISDGSMVWSILEELTWTWNNDWY